MASLLDGDLGVVEKDLEVAKQRHDINNILISVNLGVLSKAESGLDIDARIAVVTSRMREVGTSMAIRLGVTELIEIMSDYLREVLIGWRLVDYSNNHSLYNSESVNILTFALKALREFFGDESSTDGFDLESFVCESRSFLTSLSSSKGVDLRMRNELEGGRQALVRMNKQQLTHVLIELVKNATDMLEIEEQEDKTVLIRIYSCERDGSEYFAFSVADSGKGIPEGLESQIFEYGFTTKSTGSGVGLASLAERISSSGGLLIQKRSEELGGAEFQVLLPSQKQESSVESDLRRETKTNIQFTAEVDTQPNIRIGDGLEEQEDCAGSDEGEESCKVENVSS